LLVDHTDVEPPSANLDGETEIADGMLAPRPEADLDVNNLWRPGPRLLGTLDGFGDNVR
jgi:hypothetical protein